MIKDFVDHTFIVNLDERTDRWAQVQEELSKTDIPEYERFSAIKPSFDILVEEEYNNMRLAGRNKNLYRIAACGVKRSHIKIIQKAKKKLYKQILILEDDVVFDENANNIFQNAIVNLPENWSMFYLGGAHHKPYISISENLCQIQRTYAAHAYIVKENIYDIILEKSFNSGYEIDVFYANEIHPNFSCYCVRPHIAWQRAGFSNILNTNKNYTILRE